MGDLVPREKLVKQGMKGVGGVAGGIGALVLRGLTVAGGLSIPGLIIGGVVTVVGMAIGSSREDRTAGLITAGAGALTVLGSLPFLGGLGSGLLGLAGFGLLIGGGINLFKFLVNLRKRR